MSTTYFDHPLRLVVAICLSFLFSLQAIATTEPTPTIATDQETISQLGKSLRVGDVVFIHVTALPFEKISKATQSWVNHVGIVVDVSQSEPLIAESTFPVSRTTKLSRFVARSKDGRIAVARLDKPLTEQQSQAVSQAASKRLHILYDTGFDLTSRRQFCSRFVREVLAEATEINVGEIETFDTLLKRNPQTDIIFWRAWYLGSIPWDRKTVTPASVLHSDRLNVVFDGFVNR